MRILKFFLPRVFNARVSLASSNQHELKKDLFSLSFEFRFSYQAYQDQDISVDVSFRKYGSRSMISSLLKDPCIAIKPSDVTDHWLWKAYVLI